jgi:hypothetical protein
MTPNRTRSITAMLCVALSGCTAVSPPAAPPALPPGVFGVYQDNDVGAINQSSWAFSAARRTRGNPFEAARSVIAVEYLADELHSSPRWVALSAGSTLGMIQARIDTRRALGIAPDAPPQLVVDALLRFMAAQRAGDQAASLRALGAPVFTLPASQTLRILSDLPYIASANAATIQAMNESFIPGR